MRWLFAFFLFSTAALAYLPPAFYLYAQVAEHRGKGTIPASAITVSRPLPSGTEEVLGTLNLPGLAAEAVGGWPTLSLLFSSDGNALTQAARAFGLSVSKESDLLRASREQVAAMKNPPHPFYKPDPSVSLKRFRQTYAWVHSDKDIARSIWVEKDTFLPLKIEAPCPKVDLSWAKSGENRCSVEFRNVYSLRRGNAGGGRITFLKNGFPVLYFSFDRLSAAQPNGTMTLSSDAKFPEEIRALASILFH
jgi:hypothetical protein